MGGILQTVAGILHFSPGVVSFTTCKGNDNGVILQDFRHNLQECALWAFFCVARPARRAWLAGRGLGFARKLSPEQTDAGNTFPAPVVLGCLESLR